MKTLEDIGIEGFAVIYPQSSFTTGEADIDVWITAKQLKVLAIEWIKYYEEWLEDHDLEVSETQYKIKWIKEFFNIEECDLR